MPSATVEAAFQAKLASSWTVSPVVGANGVTEAPADAQAFLVVHYPVVNGEKPVLGRYYFEEGAARLILNVKSGIGLPAGLAWADTLAALFRDVDLGNGVETFTPSAPIVDDANDDGQWFELAVIVPYRFQFAG